MAEGKTDSVAGKIESLPLLQDGQNGPVSVSTGDRIAYNRAKATNLIAGALLITVCISILPMLVVAVVAKDKEVYDRAAAVWDRWLNIIGPLAGVAVYAYFREGHAPTAMPGMEALDAKKRPRGNR